MSTVIARLEEMNEKENLRPAIEEQQNHVNFANAGKSCFGRSSNKQSQPAEDAGIVPQAECSLPGIENTSDTLPDSNEDEWNTDVDGRTSLESPLPTPIFASTPTLHCIEEGSTEESKSTPITPSSLIKPMSVANDSSPWMGMSGERSGDENVRDIRIWQNYALGAAVSISNNATGAIALLEDIMKEATSHSSLTTDQTQLVEKQQKEIGALRKRNAIVEEQLAALQTNAVSDQTRLLEKQKREILVLRKLNTKTEESVAKMKATAEKAQKELGAELARGEKISTMLEDCEAIAEERRLMIKSQQATIEQMKTKLSEQATNLEPPGSRNLEIKEGLSESEQDAPQVGAKALADISEKAAAADVPKPQLRATFKEVTAGLRSLSSHLDEKLQNVEDELRAEFAQRRGMHFSRRVRNPKNTTGHLKPGVTSALLDRQPCFSTSLSDSDDSGSDSDTPGEAATTASTQVLQ